MSVFLEHISLQGAGLENTIPAFPAGSVTPVVPGGHRALQHHCPISHIPVYPRVVPNTAPHRCSSQSTSHIPVYPRTAPHPTFLFILEVPTTSHIAVYPRAHPTSHILHPTSHIPVYPRTVPNTAPHPCSSQSTSHIPHPTFLFIPEHIPTSHIPHPCPSQSTSHIPHPTFLSIPEQGTLSSEQPSPAPPARCNYSSSEQPQIALLEALHSFYSQS